MIRFGYRNLSGKSARLRPMTSRCVGSMRCSMFSRVSRIPGICRYYRIIWSRTWSTGQISGRSWTGAWNTMPRPIMTLRICCRWLKRHRERCYYPMPTTRIEYNPSCNMSPTIISRLRPGSSVIFGWPMLRPPGRRCRTPPPGQDICSLRITGNSCRKRPSGILRID